MTKIKTIRVVLWLFLLGLIAAFGSIYYVFNMPRRNVSNEKAVYILQAKQLISDFRNDETIATKKYLDQAIAVTGEIKSIRTLDNHSMVFSLEDAMEGVSCTVDSADVVKYNNKLGQITAGSKLTFKGRCSGMLMDIQVINCVPE
jgi:tRNA_anti-like